MRAQARGVDFSGGKRGAVLPPAKGKTRITIRLDTDLLDWFRREVDRAGGGNYQTLINEALRAHVEGKRESLEGTAAARAARGAGKAARPYFRSAACGTSTLPVRRMSRELAPTRSS